MRPNWRLRKIGELCDVVSGQSPDGRFYNSLGKGLPFFQGKKDFGEVYIGDPKIWTTQVTKVARDGDILMSVRAPVGPINFARGEICIGRGLAAIRPRENLDKRFLFYQLEYLQPSIGGKAGAVFPSINKSEIEALPCWWSSLAEQQRIVGLLDKAFSGISTAMINVEKNLDNVRDLADAQVNQIFSQFREVRKIPFAEIATFRNGINFTKSSKGALVKIVGVRDFKNRFWVDIDGLEAIAVDGKLSDDDTLKKNDILFVRSNGNVELIGRSLMVADLSDRIAHSGFTIRARLNNNRNVMPLYVCHFVKSGAVRRQMIDGGNGASIKNLNQGILANLMIPVPSVAEQAEIIKRLENSSEQTRQLESFYQRKLAALDELKKSLLHQAFSGNL